MSALPSDRVAIGLPGTDGGDGLTVIARNALGVDHTTPARMHREPAPDAFPPGTRTATPGPNWCPMVGRSGPLRAPLQLRCDCMEHEPGATRRDAPVVSPQIEGRQRSPETVRKGDGHECCQDQCDHRARGPARELRGAVPEPCMRSREDSRLRAVQTAAPAGGPRSVPRLHPLG